MKMVIGPTPHKFMELVKDSIKVDKICGLDKTVEYQVYLFESNVNEIGLIMGTEILLDELFITYLIKEVYVNNTNDIIKEYCEYYGVPLYII